MIKTLVTGGAGFVGSGLVRRLLERGHQVVVLDDMSRGSRANLPSDENLLIIEGDIRDERSLREAMADRPNYVFHLAALHYIPYCNAHPNETISVNVHGTQCVLTAVREAGTVEKLIFASTAAVYAPASTPHVESELLTPIDIYGVSKLCGEFLTRLFHHETGISVVNARLFNVIGPRETNPHLIPDILDQLPGPSIRLGNLMPKRDYIHVEDVADALLCLLDSPLKFGAVNVGTGHAFSASDVVKTIETVLGEMYEIVSVADRQRPGDRPLLAADTTKLVSLGWRCKHDFAEAIKDTLRFYGHLRDARSA